MPRNSSFSLSGSQTGPLDFHWMSKRIAERSAIRFDIQWKSKGPVWEPLKLKLELRGIAEGNLPRQLTLEQPVEPTGWLGRWTGLTLGGQDYKTFGEVIAWRVTLWENDQLIGEQKSFLW